MLLAKQQKPLEALNKFKQAMRVYPQNLNALLNASQLIIEHKQLNSDPERVQEAKQFLTGIKIDESDIRWKRYQNLLGKVSNA